MEDFERQAVGLEITEHLDCIVEIINDNVDSDDEDDGFLEIIDLIERISAIINRG